MKVGIDLGGSHIGLGVIDNEKNIVEQFEKYFSEDEKKNAIEVIEKYIVEMVQELEKIYEIDGIGIAIPGVAKNGIILRTVNLGINNYDIGKSLEKSLNLPITVRNDAKCACLAEFNNMVKNDKILEDANMLFMTIGTGIGGGVIYNGKLLEGRQFEGYELGHMIIKENGIPCKCGKFGCFERYRKHIRI